MTLEDLIKLDAAGMAAQDFDEEVTLYPLGAAAALATLELRLAARPPRGARSSW